MNAGKPRKSAVCLFISLLMMMFSVPLCYSEEAPTKGGQAELLWYGQSAFRLITLSGKVIVIDPWILKNPKTPANLKDLDRMGKVDLVIVTHGHWDHIADAPEIARKNNVPLWGPGDLNQTLTLLGVLPAQQLPRFNKGGTINPFPGVKITAVHAEHSSIYVAVNPATGEEQAYPGGEPIGFIIELENGFKIYHAGDTGLFGDMALIEQLYKPDLALLPIGGHFTMGPQDAALAVNQYLKPTYVIPMHYQTNPFNIGSPEDFVKYLGKSKTKALVLKPGETVRFDAKKKLVGIQPAEK